MRAIEFLNEDASAGATSSGNVATVAMAQQTKNNQTFFGVSEEDMPESLVSKPIVIRRNNPRTSKNKKD